MAEDEKTYIIAEMACSHDGDVDLARKIIEGAGEAGADAIQFQIWKAENIVVPEHQAMPTLKSIELSYKTWEQLAKFSRESFPEMDIIACVYDKEAVEISLDIGVEAFKIHAADLANPPLLMHVGGLGRRVDLSIGAASLSEIQCAVNILNESGCWDIFLMYGLQRFPTPVDVIDMKYMMNLGSLFGLPVGYQDHSDADSEEAFWLPAAALGAGVRALEKHITHDRSKKGIDHEAALNPGEFRKFVTMIRTLDSAMGTGRPRPFIKEELEYREYSRKSLVLTRDMEAGEKIAVEDLMAMRAPSLGIPPDRQADLTGRQICRSLKKYYSLEWEDIE